MKILNVLFYVHIIVYCIIYIFLLFKTKKFFKNLLLNAIIGIGVLFLLMFLKNITGIYIPINKYTFTSAAVGGIPAISGILILNVFFSL